MNLRMRKRFLGWVLLISLSAFMVANSSCMSPKQKAAIDEALKSLRKVASATEVGVTYMKYGDLLIEAKASLNEALLIMTNQKQKSILNDIMGCYEDAFTIWGRKIQNDHSTLSSSRSEDDSIIRKYRLPTEAGSMGDRTIDSNDALHRIWAIASSELASLSR